jgi:hypothetical protein
MGGEALGRVLRERDTLQYLIGKAEHSMRQAEGQPVPAYLPGRVDRLLYQLQLNTLAFNVLTQNGHCTDPRYFEGPMNNFARQGVLDVCIAFFLSRGED